MSLKQPIPEVEAHLTPDASQILLSCPYCGLWHLHGAAGEGMAGGGHRVSHCPKGVPSADGYSARITGFASPQILREVRREWSLSGETLRRRAETFAQARAGVSGGTRRARRRATKIVVD